MTVDEYVLEEDKRRKHIEELRAKGSEIEANQEHEKLKRWQIEQMGFCEGMPITIGCQLKLIRVALRGEM